MEGWRQRRPGSNEKKPSERKRKNRLDTNRPSHGRTWLQRWQNGIAGVVLFCCSAPSEGKDDDSGPSSIRCHARGVRKPSLAACSISQSVPSFIYTALFASHATSVCH